MTPTSAYAIVQNDHHAWTSGRVDRAMTWATDDINWSAADQDLSGTADYRAFTAGFAPALTGLPNITTFADEDQIALFYYPQTAATTTAPAAEYLKVRDGKIADSVLVFDRLSFGPATHA